MTKWSEMSAREKAEYTIGISRKYHSDLANVAVAIDAGSNKIGRSILDLADAVREHGQAIERNGAADREAEQCKFSRKDLTY